MNSAQKEISDLLKEQQNFDISKYDEIFYFKSLTNRLSTTNCNNEDEYLKLLDNNTIEINNLIQSLFVSYSEFFRNSLTFSVLEHEVLPTLIRRKLIDNQQEIRIWSAACAGGQEAYSLAILFKEMNVREKINIRIFATDHSENEIEKAQKGHFCYSDLSQVSLKRLDKWFIKEGETYKIKDELKDIIHFSVFDLLEKHSQCPPASIFCDFDLIICANILFYYKPDVRKEIILKMKKSLSEIGYLVTGETEREMLLQYNFQEVFPKSSIFKTK